MSKIQLNGIISSPTHRLAPMMRKWQRLMKSLGTDWADKKHGNQRDVPWWYGERTAVGLLAGAIWRSGGECLEEFAAEKKHKSKRRRKKKSPGRGDLMFSLNGKTWYVAEAKLMETSLNSKIPISKKAREKLKHARQDAVRTPSYGWAKRVGLLFVVPYATSQPADSQIRDWITDLNKFRKTGLVWTFPRMAADLYWPDKQNGKRYYYPRIALLVRPPRSN